MDDVEFASFLQGLRHENPQALETLNRLYGPYLCQAVRPWLAEANLRRISDSIDICQPVLFAFVRCMKAGRFQELATREHLEKVLCRMAKNAFRDLWRKERHARRGRRPVVTTPLGPGQMDIADSGSSPSQHVAREEILKLFQGRLSAEAQQIYVWRESGWDWAQIGAALEQPLNTVRIRFNRECARVAETLGLKKKT